MTGGPLLHLVTREAWAEAVRHPTYGTAIVDAGGFVHLSTPDQVGLPATALFRGRHDLWLLVIDPARLPVPPVVEPGVPVDPGGRLFPHLYAPLPTASVIAVVAYEPGPDGTFGAPFALPGADDHLARATALSRYVARARATSVCQSGPGFAVRHDKFPASYDHHRVVLDDLVPAETAAELCAGALDGLAHWQVGFGGSLDDAGRAAFVAAGWQVAEHLVMLAGSPGSEAAPATPVAVEEVGLDELAAWRTADWHETLPRASADEVRQLVEREPLTDAVARVSHLAVRGDDGRPVARADLRVVGATAQIEDVMTQSAYRGRGFASALVRGAVRRARALGCDTVFLEADADDWPRHLYERLGFTTIGRGTTVDRDVDPTT